MTELTEDDIKKFSGEYLTEDYVVIRKLGMTAESIKQQILQALQENPKLKEDKIRLIGDLSAVTQQRDKLKEELERMTHLRDNWYNQATENGLSIQKLRAENEELNDKITKTQVKTSIEIKKLQQENQSLKQENRNLKFRISDEQDEQNHIKAEVHLELSRLKQLEKAVRDIDLPFIVQILRDNSNQSENSHQLELINKIIKLQQLLEEKK